MASTSNPWLGSRSRLSRSVAEDDLDRRRALAEEREFAPGKLDHLRLIS